MRYTLKIDTPAKAIAFLIASALAVACVIVIAVAPTWRLYAELPAGPAGSTRIRVVQGLATRWASAPPDVLLLGGSQIGELLPEDEFVSAQLSAACNRPVTVFNASTSSQVLEESWAIAELAAAREQLVMVAVNPWRLTELEDPRSLRRALLPLPEPRSMPRSLFQLPMSTPQRRWVQLGILAEDLLAAGNLRGALVHERTGPYDSFQHLYRAPAWPLDAKRAEAAFLTARLRSPHASNFEDPAFRFTEFANYLAGTQRRAAFVFVPASPMFNDTAHSSGLQQEAWDSLPGAEGILDLRHEALLDEDDFYDTHHLLASGRRKLWPHIREFMVAHLADCGAGRHQ